MANAISQAMPQILPSVSMSMVFNVKAGTMNAQMIANAKSTPRLSALRQSATHVPR
ncbi:MAG: hypothetical protein O7G84_14530 [Gammaproteobacteria bacterium]|nr:hypothetical protein [Gammaproteobacteria bacterium]